MPCRTLVYIEDIPSLVDDPDTDNTFVYGPPGPFKAVYTVLNVTDLEGNQIGMNRIDAKVVSIPGSITVTYTSVTNIDNGPENSADYVYLAGTRQYIVDSAGFKIGYENTVVQNVVSCNETYNHGTIDMVLLPEKKKILVTVRY